MSDGALSSSIGTINVSVDPVNDVPVITSNIEMIVSEDTRLEIALSEIVSVVRDVEGDDLRSIKIEELPIRGELSNKGVAVDILPGLPQGGFVDRQALFNLRFSLRYVPDFSSKLENFSVVFL